MESQTAYLVKMIDKFQQYDFVLNFFSGNIGYQENEMPYDFLMIEEICDVYPAYVDINVNSFWIDPEETTISGERIETISFVEKCFGYKI